MTIKESKIVWIFIGQMNGFLLILNSLSKCIHNNILTDIFTDMKIKIKDIENQLKSLENE